MKFFSGLRWLWTLSFLLTAFLLYVIVDEYGWNNILPYLMIGAMGMFVYFFVNDNAPSDNDSNDNDPGDD